MRVFAALPLPAEAVAALRRTTEQLRSRAPGLKWTDSQGLHLTLHFFGELDSGEVERVGALWDDAALASDPIEARFSRFGEFPEQGNPRVLWVGIGEGAERIVSYQRRFAARLATLGYAEDPRGFSPHVTLARNRGERLAEGWMAGVEAPALAFSIVDCVLFQSILGPRGARYVPLRDLRFAKEPR